MQRRLATIEDPRSIESGPGGHVVVAHPAAGALSLLTMRPARVRRVLRGLGAPRYAAIAPDGAHAFVSDGARGELVVVDLARGRIVAGVEVGAGARHLSLDPAGRTLWIALGSSAAAIAVVDVGDPRRPRLRRRVRPPFLAHDVAFSPSGRRVWITAGRERRLAVLPAAGGRPGAAERRRGAPARELRARRRLRGQRRRRDRARARSRCTDACAGPPASPYGSYNVQAGAGAVVTPSLARGTLTILDRAGRVQRELQVAPAAHDACLIR